MYRKVYSSRKRNDEPLLRNDSRLSPSVSLCLHIDLMRAYINNHKRRVQYTGRNLERAGKPRHPKFSNIKLN